MQFKQMNIDGIRTVAETLRNFANEYEEIANEADREQFRVLKVRGFESLSTAVFARIESNIRTCRKALSDAKNESVRDKLNKDSEQQDEPIPTAPPRTATVGRKRKSAPPPVIQPQAKKGKATG